MKTILIWFGDGSPLRLRLPAYDGPELVPEGTVVQGFVVKPDGAMFAPRTIYRVRIHGTSEWPRPQLAGQPDSDKPVYCATRTDAPLSGGGIARVQRKSVSRHSSK